jgi:hypothetical protein
MRARSHGARPHSSRVIIRGHEAVAYGENRREHGAAGARNTRGEPIASVGWKTARNAKENRARMTFVSADWELREAAVRDVVERVARITHVHELDDLVIIDRYGKPEVRIGWNVALVFEQGETLEKRRLANAMLGDALATFGEHITHFDPFNGNRMKKIRGFDLLAYCDAEAAKKTANRSGNANDAYGTAIFGYPGGKALMEPAPFYLYISTNSRRRVADQSIAEANFPLGFLWAEDFAPVIELFVRWCSIVRPAHGTVSPGIVLTQGSGGNALAQAYPLVARFPGLDCGDPTRWLSRSRALRKIRTIGWLTAIDDGFVEELGGLDRIARQLGPDVAIRPFAGGIVMQAGPTPSLGDRNGQIIPTPYQTVAGMLEPLIFKDFARGLFHPLPPSYNSEDETQKWLQRFETGATR